MKKHWFNLHFFLIGITTLFIYGGYSQDNTQVYNENYCGLGTMTSLSGDCANLKWHDSKTVTIGCSFIDPNPIIPTVYHYEDASSTRVTTIGYTDGNLPTNLPIGNISGNKIFNIPLGFTIPQGNDYTLKLSTVANDRVYVQTGGADYYSSMFDWDISAVGIKTFTHTRSLVISQNTCNITCEEDLDLNTYSVVSGSPLYGT